MSNQGDVNNSGTFYSDSVNNDVNNSNSNSNSVNNDVNNSDSNSDSDSDSDSNSYVSDLVLVPFTSPSNLKLRMFNPYNLFSGFKYDISSLIFNGNYKNFILRLEDISTSIGSSDESMSSNPRSTLEVIEDSRNDILKALSEETSHVLRFGYVLTETTSKVVDISKDEIKGCIDQVNDKMIVEFQNLLKKIQNLPTHVQQAQDYHIIQKMLDTVISNIDKLLQANVNLDYELNNTFMKLCSQILEQLKAVEESNIEQNRLYVLIPSIFDHFKSISVKLENLSKNQGALAGSIKKCISEKDQVLDNRLNGLNKAILDSTNRVSKVVTDSKAELTNNLSNDLNKAILDSTDRVSKVVTDSNAELVDNLGDQFDDLKKAILDSSDRVSKVVTNSNVRMSNDLSNDLKTTIMNSAYHIKNDLKKAIMDSTESNARLTDSVILNSAGKVSQDVTEAMENSREDITRLNDEQTEKLVTLMCNFSNLNLKANDKLSEAMTDSSTRLCEDLSSRINAMENRVDEIVREVRPKEFIEIKISWKYVWILFIFGFFYFGSGIMSSKFGNYFVPKIANSSLTPDIVESINPNFESDSKLFSMESSYPTTEADSKLPTIESSSGRYHFFDWSGNSNKPEVDDDKVDDLEVSSGRYPLFVWKSGNSNKPLVSFSWNPKPFETDLVELSTKSKSSIFSVKNFVCLMFVYLVVSYLVMYAYRYNIVRLI